MDLDFLNLVFTVVDIYDFSAQNKNKTYQPNQKGILTPTFENTLQNSAVHIISQSNIKQPTHNCLSVYYPGISLYTISKYTAYSPEDVSTEGYYDKHSLAHHEYSPSIFTGSRDMNKCITVLLQCILIWEQPLPCNTYLK